MASYNAISIEKLVRLIGTPKGPVVIDVRDDEDFAAQPLLLPASFRRPYAEVRQWGPDYRGRWVVVVCQKGKKLSEGVAAWLRNTGAEAETLEGGFEAWQAAHPGQDVFEDRALEITGYLPISVEDWSQALTRAQATGTRP